eukprot:6480335-Amphidinium_carterae.1
MPQGTCRWQVVAGRHRASRSVTSVFMWCTSGDDRPPIADDDMVFVPEVFEVPARSQDPKHQSQKESHCKGKRAVLRCA